jgi:hypothetical protein
MTKKSADRQGHVADTTPTTGHAPSPAVSADDPVHTGSRGAPSLSGNVGHDRRVIGSLQRRAGNQAVGRLVTPLHPGPLPQTPVQRIPIGGWMPVPVLTEKEKVERAARTLDKGDIKDIRDWSKATSAQKMQFIDALNSGWTGPFDEYALEAIWGSFGDKMIDVADGNPGRWDSSLKNGAELYKLGAAKTIADRFLVDVRSVASGNLDSNDRYCVDELARLGEGKPGAPGGTTAATGGGVPPTPEQRLDELQTAARLTKMAREAQGKLSYEIVGLRKNTDPQPEPGVSLPGGIWTPYINVAFDPTNPPSEAERRPESGAFPPGTDLPTIKSWDDIKQEWDSLQAFEEGLTIAYPVVGITAGNAPGGLDVLAGDDPKAAKAMVVGQLNTVRENIEKTRPKMGVLAYELKPIHDMLFTGAAKPSGVDWSKPVAKSLANELVELHEDREFWVTMGLSTAAAALFVIASFLTAGTATAIMVGAGVGIGAGQAAVSWDKALTMSAAAKASPSGLDPLVTSGQADMALFEAVLNTILVAVDVLTSVKPLVRAASGGIVREALVAGRGAKAATNAGLESLAKLGAKEAPPAGSRAVVEKAISELGIERVSQQTRRSAAELLEIVGKDSPAAARLDEFIKVQKALGAITPAELVRRSANLGAEIVADPQLGQQIAHLAVERFGPASVLQCNGGWGRLSVLLGNKSEAGKAMLAWRDGILGDIETYVKTLPGGVDEAGKAAVKRTGSTGEFTNDFDVSLLGPHASENRNAVRSFVAGRLGTTPDRLKFLVLADFFTDPRRLHLYDQLDPILRARIASRAEKVAEGTIFARMLHDADKAGNVELAKALRKMMADVKVEEVAYKELGAADIGALYKNVDELHISLDKAVKAGDKGAQAQLVDKIGDTQGLINAAEGGGYFSGGATAMLVSLKEGLLAPGAKLLPEQAYTALLDQLPKLYGEANSLLRTGFVATGQVVEAIKGIGKYGKRFRDLMTALDVKVADEAVWNGLAQRCDKLLLEAKGKAGTSTLQRLTTDADALSAEVNSLLNDFTAQAPTVLASLSKQAGLSGRAVDLARIQFLVRAQAKLLRSATAIKESMAVIVGDIQRMALAASAPGSGAGSSAGAGEPPPVP